MRGLVPSYFTGRCAAGFSLVELLVSLSIFAIIMTASVGTLITLIDMNAKGQAIYSATTNLSFALDNMTRELRMGYHYYCKNSDQTNEETLPNIENAILTDDYADCLSGGDYISFMRERDNWQIGYRLHEGHLQQKTNNPSGGTGDTGWENITSEDVAVTNLQFVVVKSEPYCINSECSSYGDNNQPTLTLLAAGTVNNGLDNNTAFNIQSRVTQRRLDIW